MDWLTEEEIRRRAMISDEEALNVSIEHWEQICRAVEEGVEVKGHYEGNDCGLCHRYCPHFNHCGKCPLREENSVSVAHYFGTKCCLEWRTFRINKTLENAQTMLNRLYLERGKRYPLKEVVRVVEKKKEEFEPIRVCHLQVDVLTDMVRFTDFFDKRGLCAQNAADAGRTIAAIQSAIDYIEGDVKAKEDEGEDLEEFNFEGDVGGLEQGAGAHIAGDRKGVCLSFKSGCGLVRFDFPKATEFHQKLGQLIATAKRKKEGRC